MRCVVLSFAWRKRENNKCLSFAEVFPRFVTIKLEPVSMISWLGKYSRGLSHVNPWASNKLAFLARLTSIHWIGIYTLACCCCCCHYYLYCFCQSNLLIGDYYVTRKRTVLKFELSLSRSLSIEITQTQNRSGQMESSAVLRQPINYVSWLVRASQRVQMTLSKTSRLWRLFF